ncbi:hypothetical protein LCGC14_0430820 [marine sediment metagenome]|uniref:Uncharacterized protein n=1 Tax=marine sediment metagenome TaxID=412755 RepID=A0A0F9T691_9ZZZZ
MGILEIKIILYGIIGGVVMWLVFTIALHIRLELQ